MKLTRQRQISIGVLGLGLALLAADRLLLGPGDGGPSAAVASVAAPAPVTRAAAAPARTPVRSVAERLADKSVGVGEQTADAFALPHGWLPPEAAQEAKAVEADKAPLPQVTAVFPRTITGVAEATINKQRVRVGETVDGWTVLKILGAAPGEKPGVRLAYGGREVEITTDARMTPRRNGAEPVTVTPKEIAGAERVPDDR